MDFTQKLTKTARNLARLIRTKLMESGVLVPRRPLPVIPENRRAARITRKDVLNAYDVLLGRPPESEAVIETAMKKGSKQDLLKMFMFSPEFQQKNPGILEQSTKWVWTDTTYGFRLKVNLMDLVISRQIIEDKYEASETALVKSLVKPGDVVLDVGGNIGYYTHLFAILVGPLGRVHAFEPLTHLAEALTASVMENGFEDRVAIYNVALADHDGEATMIYVKDGMNSGGGYLSFDDARYQGHNRITVPIRRLENLVKFDRLDFIKLDCEGAEFKVLRSMKDTLKRLNPKIMAEVSSDHLQRTSQATAKDLFDLMSGIGYGARIVEGGQALRIVENHTSATHINVLFEKGETSHSKRNGGAN
jgi:FkbM family methyltransferase